MGQYASSGRLEDRYFLQKVKLGQGAFGTVWRAVDRQTDEIVAVKQLDKAALPRRNVRREDVEREIAVMQALSHENITKLLGCFEDSQNIYLALEYCDGGDFGDKVKERGMELKEEEAAEWMRQMLSALVALHRKSICHRDIKPDNFMVHAGAVKLADFGLAVFVPPGRLLQDKCGTPAFMAPEIHALPRHSRGYSLAVDLWAAGVTMYMVMFGGKHPFVLNGNQLDDKRLMAGELDFHASQGLLAFAGPWALRFSEPARRLCQGLVEAKESKRLTAQAALQEPWLHAGGHARAGSRGPAAADAGGAGTPRGRASSRAGSEAPRLERSNSRGWWPFGADSPEDNLQAKNAQLCQKVEDLEKVMMLQQQQIERQHAQNESQFEVMQQLSAQQRQQRRQAPPPLPGYRPGPRAPSRGPGGSELAQASPRHRSPSVSAGSSHASGASGAQQGSTWNPNLLTRLPSGTPCLYFSSSQNKWINAKVLKMGDDGTCDLDVRQQAKLENVSPTPTARVHEAWPAGTMVYYESSSVGKILPAVVRSFNEPVGGGQGTYNLDVRNCAPIDRIRPRVG